MSINEQEEIAYFGGGCFWCTEAVFVRLRGVISVTPGYAGGHTPQPSYEQVCSGSTGHAEVVRVIFDSGKIAYQDLLSVFFAVHDPTTLNKQGADEGTQYRSVIFYTTESQKDQAEERVQEYTESGTFHDPIVTEILPIDTFFPAEDYHHNYYARNRNAAYCRLVIDPKLQKLFSSFGDFLKP